MLVYIGNLPGDTKLTEIQKLLSARSMSVDYTTYRSKTTDNHDYHFILAKTNNNESADDLVGELNGKVFHGAELEARRFVKRKKQAGWLGSERRTNQFQFHF